MLKTILQIIFIYLPIINWNLNVDIMTTKMGIMHTLVGFIMAFLIEWIFKFCKYMKD